MADVVDVSEEFHPSIEARHECPSSDQIILLNFSLFVTHLIQKDLKPPRHDGEEGIGDRKVV